VKAGLAASALALLALVSAPATASDFTDDMQPASAAALKKGLAYLASTQRPDGSWGSWNGPTTGVVAACTLAFLANGQVPGSGEYGQVTARAIDFLIKNAQPSGLIYKNGMGPFPMYHHGLATLALGEAWGQSQDPRIRDALKRAVDLICSCQNQRGGWRYNPRVSDDDLSATVMQLMALRAAKDAGLEVPKDVIDAGIGYVKACHNGKGQGKDGGFAYQPGGGSGFARTGAGVTSLQVAGNYKASEVSEGVDFLLQFKPLGTRAEETNFYYYGLYYATMGIYQAQGIGAWGRKAWQTWYPAVTKSLVASQTAEGKWDGPYDQFACAVPLLILAIPCRYLPIYQR
jgi:prenyltransferase beta subunit